MTQGYLWDNKGQFIHYESSVPDFQSRYRLRRQWPEVLSRTLSWKKFELFLKKCIEPPLRPISCVIIVVWTLSLYDKWFLYVTWCWCSTLCSIQLILNVIITNVLIELRNDSLMMTHQRVFSFVTNLCLFISSSTIDACSASKHSNSSSTNPLSPTQNPLPSYGPFPLDGNISLFENVTNLAKLSSLLFLINEEAPDLWKNFRDNHLSVI